MDNVSIGAKRLILQEQLQKWRNTQYAAKVDADVADVLEDEGMKAKAVARLARAVKAAGAIEKMLEELEPPPDRSHPPEPAPKS